MKIASFRPNVTICFAIFVYFLQVAIEMINNRIAKLVSHRTENDEIRLWIDWNSWLLSAKWWTQNQKHLKRMHRWSFQNLKDFFFGKITFGYISDTDLHCCFAFAQASVSLALFFCLCLRLFSHTLYCARFFSHFPLNKNIWWSLCVFIRIFGLNAQKRTQWKWTQVHTHKPKDRAKLRYEWYTGRTTKQTIVFWYSCAFFGLFFSLAHLPNNNFMSSLSAHTKRSVFFGKEN